MLAGCANINSIDRTTLLGMDTPHGKAVHLDARQRLVVVNKIGEYCAEPSPDALAAYAAALGVGAGVPGTGAGALAAGQQSAAASIGLRTQSITLMRDALYRMCEAYANDKISAAQVPALLGRSQDLTAVILATEQLTGAVAANQVALTGTTTADASATALASSELLDAALANEERKQAALEQAKADLVQARAEREQAEQALAEAKATLDGLNQNPNATTQQKRDAEADVRFRRSERDRAQTRVVTAETRVDLRQKALDDAQRTRQAIEQNQDTALANAGAGTTSAALFSTPGQARQLDVKATEAVASAVQAMVQTVLLKDYTQDSCMSLMTTSPETFGIRNAIHRQQYESIQALCLELLSASLNEQIRQKQSFFQFSADNSTEILREWLNADEANVAQLRRAMQANRFDGTVTELLYGARYQRTREELIRRLGIR